MRVILKIKGQEEPVVLEGQKVEVNHYDYVTGLLVVRTITKDIRNVESVEVER